MLLLLLLLTVGAVSVRAEQVIVIVCDALTWDDWHNNAYPHLYRKAEQGAIGLMNTAVAGPKTPTSALLTLALGRQALAEPDDELAGNSSETLTRERGTIAEIYWRRTGTEAITTPAAPDALWHLNLASLQRRHLNGERLGAILGQAPPPRSAVVFGNADTDRPQRRAALLTLDTDGRGSGITLPARRDADSPFGVCDDPLQLTEAVGESEAGLIVVQLGDTARVEALRPHLADAQYRKWRDAALRRLDLFVFLLDAKLQHENKRADVMTVSPYPPGADAAHPHEWNRLAPLVAWGPHFLPGRLTSPTTRTVGLVANGDVAPTILHLLGVPVPVSMVGRAMRTEPGGTDEARIAQLARMDYVVHLNQRAQLAIMPALLVGCALLVGGGLWALRTVGARAARAFAFGLVCVLNLPLALLGAPLLVPPTLWEYGLRIGAWMGMAGLLCAVLGRVLRQSPALLAGALLLLVLVGDTLTGQNLQKFSLMSDYPLSGIRYYGIGNEYLGVAFGFALVDGFAWLDRHAARQSPRMESVKHWVPVLAWLALTLLFGWPGLGANTGSLIVGAAGFGVGAVTLAGRKTSWRTGLLFALLGLLLAFGFATWDAQTAALSAGPSQAGLALQTAGNSGQGVGYLADIVIRKLGMNLRLLTAPWFVITLIGIALLIWAGYALAGRALRTFWQQQEWLRQSGPALSAALLTGLLFKDSGVIVAVLLLAGAGVLTLTLALEAA